MVRRRAGLLREQGEGRCESRAVVHTVPGLQGRKGAELLRGGKGR